MWSHLNYENDANFYGQLALKTVTANDQSMFRVLLFTSNVHGYDLTYTSDSIAQLGGNSLPLSSTEKLSNDTSLSQKVKRLAFLFDLLEMGYVV